YAHALGDLLDVQVRAADVQHVHCLLVGAVGADAHELHLKDLVLAVGKDDVDYVQVFPRLGPEGLDGVHGAAVAVQADYLAVGAGDCRAGGDREAKANAAAGQLQPVVAADAFGEAGGGAAGGGGFVDDNDVVRQQGAEREADAFRAQRAAHQVRSFFFLNARLQLLCIQRLHQIVNGSGNVFVHLRQ